MAKNIASFSHLDSRGEVRMVGVAHKPDQFRVAVAESRIKLQPQTVVALKKSALPKGDVLVVAKIAGIGAAKQTSSLIPLCHPVALHRIDLEFEVEPSGILIRAIAETVGKTGVEMEAMTAVSVAALTIYDMCKAVDKQMRIGPTRLLSKEKK